MEGQAVCGESLDRKGPEQTPRPRELDGAPAEIALPAGDTAAGLTKLATTRRDCNSPIWPSSCCGGGAGASG